MNASFFSCLFETNETLPASSGCNQAWRRWTPFDACRRSSFPPVQWLKGVWTNTIVSNLLHFLYVINKNFKIIKKVCFHCHSHEDKIHTRHRCNRLSWFSKLKSWWYGGKYQMQRSKRLTIVIIMMTMTKCSALFLYDGRQVPIIVLP